jgi:hypothetical protein
MAAITRHLTSGLRPTPLHDVERRIGWGLCAYEKFGAKAPPLRDDDAIESRGWLAAHV